MSALVAVADATGLPELCTVLSSHGLRIVTASSAAHIALVAVPHVHRVRGSSGAADYRVVVANLPAVPASDQETHSLIRSAARGFASTVVLTAPSQYGGAVAALGSADARRTLARSALEYTAALDRALASHLAGPAEAAKVLLIGGGGREHALAWKLVQSEGVSEVFVAPGNGGTACEPGVSNVAALDVKDHAAVVAFVKERGVGLVCVGPEQPLVDGLADSLKAAGVACFGPSKAAAQLEGSKAFSKAFMERHGIPTAKYQAFTDYAAAQAYLASVGHKVVIKASGLAAGKGVLLPETEEEAQAALKQVMVDNAFGDAGAEVVIEELLIGPEVSVLAFCDGRTVLRMPGAQDHKRALDGDKGLNTGGMGAYAPAPVFTPELQEQTERLVLQAAVDGCAAEGFPYVGVLYAGLMLTPDGLRCLEFNARFGDPETQVLMPLLDGDLYEIMMACVEGRLPSASARWHEGAACTVVAASEGYPQSYPKGRAITGLGAAAKAGAVVFHAGTKALEGGELATSGGRVLAVSARGESLRAAVDRAYTGLSGIKFEGMQYRSDIAHRAMRPPVKIGVLGSTRGTDLQAVLDAIGAGKVRASVEVVVSNKEDAYILTRAKEAGVDAVHVPSKGKKRSEFDAEVGEVLRAHGVDLVLLIGYMRILSDDFVDEWWGKCLNVHPSLLPDFAGGMDKDVHCAVLEAGRAESGCTVHLVSKVVDGGAIVVQKRCAVAEGETKDTLKAKVQALEGVAFLEAIRMFQDGKVEELAAAGDGPSSAPKRGTTYADAGVDIDAGNALIEMIKPHCKATRRPGCDASLGGFGGVFDLKAAGYVGDTLLVACTDGVGTKLKIAQVLESPDTVGVDLVAMCVNDLVVQGAEPLFFLDYFATGKLDTEVAARVVAGIADGCVQAGCGLIGGETAEMPSMYGDGEYDLAGFSVGAVARTGLLPVPLNAGDVMLALPSSGVHSNGFSLVRKLVGDAGLTFQDDAPFRPGTTLGQALLVPTKIYVKQLMPAIKAGRISALAHITGGGLLENIPRVLPPTLSAVVEADSWSLPPIFRWLASLGNVEQNELLKTFNCGVGMILVVPAPDADSLLEHLKASGEPGAFKIGVLAACAAGDAQVVINGDIYAAER